MVDRVTELKNEIENLSKGMGGIAIHPSSPTSQLLKLAKTRAELSGILFERSRIIKIIEKKISFIEVYETNSSRVKALNDIKSLFTNLKDEIFGEQK